MKKLYLVLFAVLVYTQISAQCFRVIKSDGTLQNLGIKTDGSLWAWGHNNFGQLGDGTYGPGANKSTPKQIGTATNWESIAVGLYHSVALKTDGTLWTWGLNLSGELGDGTYDYGTEKYVPTQIGTATDWKHVAAGAYHTLAIKTDGSLWAWGSNSFGQLGDGTNGLGNDKYIPTKIGTATWKFVIAGTYHTMALKTDNTLWAWGSNLDGILGDGTLDNKNTPTQIGTATNWQSISTSNYHTAAIKTDGTLWTWGQHSWGKLGNGSYLEPTVPIPPTQIGTATNWKMVSAGGNHTLAVKTDGTYWAWGYNAAGEYGDGVFGFNNFTPEQIGTATNWDAVATGFGHSLLIKSDETLWTTGSNYLNQLGDGTTTNKNTPGQVGCASLGIEDASSRMISFVIYPNPAKDVMYIKNTSDISVNKIFIYDLVGKKVAEQNDTIYQVNIQHLQPGIYFLQVVTDEKSYLNKFIKE